MQGEGGAPSSSVTVDILQAGICLNPPQAEHRDDTVLPLLPEGPPLSVSRSVALGSCSNQSEMQIRGLTLKPPSQRPSTL